MDLFELEAVALTGINRVVISHDAYKPGHFSLCFRFTVNTLINVLCTWLHLYLELSVTYPCIIVIRFTLLFMEAD